MNFTNYLHCVSETKFKTLRVGQKFMVELFNVRPDLYWKVLNSPLDPFYDDDRLAEFLIFVMDNWEHIDYSYFKKTPTKI